MSNFCGLCTACQPRYKKLVDSIFPADPNDGLKKTNMDKLTFFAMKSPDKLDKIGEYLAHRLNRDIYRQRYVYVNIAMEALDILLVACHAKSLNLFVESFLKMVQKLLECNQPQLQIRATSSFVKFANIEEDTPSYHRRYDFFVSRFSSMCHTNISKGFDSTKLRVSGLQGLQGVIRKTVKDDLQCNIWQHTHLDKIIPSLLYNMQQTNNDQIESEIETPRDEENPSQLAEMVFRDFLYRASYGTINSVIRPVLTHLDNHNLWIPNDFAVKCFKIIMNSVQAQFGYMVVQMLMSHLNQNSKEYAVIKSSIVNVLSETVLISTGGSFGSSVLVLLDTLLQHLRISVETIMTSNQTSDNEKQFQEAIINTIGQFTSNLPDYQKIDIMRFVMGKVPMPNQYEQSSTEVMLQTMSLKSLYKVASKYQTILISNALPASFFEPLLRISLVHDPGIRRIVQEILHCLIDRHENLSKLKPICINRDVNKLNLILTKPQRQDILFIKKNGPNFYSYLYENMNQPTNKVDNYESIFVTMVLIYLEMGGDEIIVELIRLALEMQNMALSTQLPITHSCAIHSLVAAFLCLISQISSVASLANYVMKVIDIRKREAIYYLPEVAFNRSSTSSSYPNDSQMKDQWLFNLKIISDLLQTAGHEISKLTIAFATRSSYIDTGDGTASVSDNQSIIDVESMISTPVTIRKGGTEDITVEGMKKIINESSQSVEEQERKRQQLIYESFKSGRFEEIVARSEAKTETFERQLNKILDMISTKVQDDVFIPGTSQEAIPIHEMKFPNLFVY